MPAVIACHVDRAFRGEDVKRRQPQVRDRLHRPAIAPIRIDIAARVVRALAKSREQRRRGVDRRRGCRERRQRCIERCAGRRADGGVLLPQQLLRLRRPRHQLAVEAGPIRRQPAPEVRRLERLAGHERAIRPQAHCCRRTADRCACSRCRCLRRRCRSAAAAPSSSRQTTTTAREPMCFSSQMTRATPSWRYSASASAGCSRRPGSALVGAGRHRRRQIDQPLGIHRESAHDLERRRRVFLADRHRRAQTGCDMPLAEHVIHIEHVVHLLLDSQRRHPR